MAESYHGSVVTVYYVHHTIPSKMDIFLGDVTNFTPYSIIHIELYKNFSWLNNFFQAEWWNN